MVTSVFTVLSRFVIFIITSHTRLIINCRNLLNLAEAMPHVEHCKKMRDSLTEFMGFLPHNLVASKQVVFQYDIGIFIL